jgi:hypothetical protein
MWVYLSDLRENRIYGGFHRVHQHWPFLTHRPNRSGGLREGLQLAATERPDVILMDL